MAALTQAATSTQPVQQIVNTPEYPDGSAYNPTTDQVFMAFVPQPNYGAATMPAPGSPLWNTAYWETTPGPVYWASCLVGPANNGIQLTPGAYLIAVRVVDNPAVPALWGWSLLIT